ncbi:TetR/AcrR family transcriptional regulator [Streptomyces brasiliensis]|uniref:TetR family transcriptional regulator n=1 Tax=Streptomyces brasiliensis TaxID=1954 RepID=A0A917KWL6_9ACTN|nr:TetR/AcrR family transcriptional regulator [Streptomyces brasiliensis]GGJ28362.1 TetR family transcriptional regulator [Streptomyces brasiliensis]
MTQARRFALPPLRADARRNYEALVAAAGEVFAAQGPDAPLDVIARRAGVGNATLYRHFPARRDLIVAVCVNEVEVLCALGERLGSSCRPGPALIEWVRSYIEHVSAHRGLAAAFNSDRREDSALIGACREAVLAIGTTLLEAAKQDGAVRTDLSIDDVLALINAVATAAETGDHERTDRLLQLIVRGIAG